jgi:hypothetical protein
VTDEQRRNDSHLIVELKAVFRKTLGVRSKDVMEKRGEAMHGIDDGRLQSKAEIKA